VHINKQANHKKASYTYEAFSETSFQQDKINHLKQAQKHQNAQQMMG
jgi:hypothetical protein